MRLTENTGHKKSPKIRHQGTITQLCRAISSQLRHVWTIGKKLVKQQYLPDMSSQYGELQPPSGWDRLFSLVLPSRFQWVSRLFTVTARHSSSGRQPNCGVEKTEPPIFGTAAITLAYIIVWDCIGVCHIFGSRNSVAVEWKSLVPCSVFRLC